MSRAARRGCACVTLAMALASCGAAPPMAQRGPALSRWSYTFALDEALTRLHATLCFEGPAPYALSPIDASGRRYLRRAARSDGEPLERVDGLLLTDGLPHGSCVRYVVDLEAAARQRGGIHGAYRIGDDLVANTAVWLWAPSHRAEHAVASARFELPAAIRVSPLWRQRGDGAYELDERAFRFSAYAAFGRFETHDLAVPGGCLHVSILGNGIEMGRDALHRSLGQGAGAASMLLGRFPEAEAGLLVVPTPFSTSSPFGVVGRGTMPVVAILVGERATEERLSRAWVPVHEFSHLAMPFIDRRDAWLSEGIATYYQEVLRARGGLLSPEEAWTNLAQGFARGAREGTGRTLAEESHEMSETAAFRRVYWSGAAIALMADVEMRRRSSGRRTLDDALAALHACCASGVAPIAGSDAIAALDAAGPPVFGPIARRALAERELPDMTRTFGALGIDPSGGSLRFGGDAPAVELREAIMAPRADLAPLSSECGARARMPR